jgi:hypothetical protein
MIAASAAEVAAIWLDLQGPPAKLLPDVRFHAPIAPVGYVRMTQQDKWRGLPGRMEARPVVVRWRQYADNIRALATVQRFSLPDHGAHYYFEIPMPVSWSKKKKLEFDG